MTDNPLMVNIIEKKIRRLPIEVPYPQVEGLKDLEVQNKINSLIKQKVHRLIVIQGGGREDLAVMKGEYQVTLNERGILSLRLGNFSYVDKAAHGLTVVKSLTINMKDGNAYQLSELFKTKSKYRLLISNLIKMQMKQREIPLIEEFGRINDDQEYYLTNKAVVVYFQIYQYTPYVVGIPQFRIPLAYISNQIDPDGPLARL